jgi:hypothetical protein
VSAGPASFGIYILLLCVIVMVLDHRRTSRMLACDACRIDGGGGSLVSIPHTCSRRQALYRSPEGDVFEFGRLVRREPKAGSTGK